MKAEKLIGILLIIIILSIFAGNAGADPISVEIKNFAFNPAQINVSNGTTVIWTNNDSAAHTVTSNTTVFDSGAFSQGQTFEWTFNQTGTFEYYCTIHPFMTGTVIVTETPTPTPTVTVIGTPTATVTGTPTVTVTVPPETRIVVEIVDNMSGVPIVNESTINILAEDFMNFNAGDRYNITITRVTGGIVEFNKSETLLGLPKETIKVDWTPQTQGAYILLSDANTTTESKIVQVINQKVISPVPELSTIALVSAGLLGLLGLARKRKNS